MDPDLEWLRRCDAVKVRWVAVGVGLQWVAVQGVGWWRQWVAVQGDGLWLQGVECDGWQMRWVAVQGVGLWGQCVAVVASAAAAAAR